MFIRDRLKWIVSENGSGGPSCYTHTHRVKYKLKYLNLIKNKLK